MSEDDRGKTNVRTLAKIARTLGMPLEAFFGPVEDDPARPSEAEEAELLGLFRAIRDPQERSRCLALMRGMAGTLPTRRKVPEQLRRDAQREEAGRTAERNVRMAEGHRTISFALTLSRRVAS